ncbi:hypothetical protein, partial [Vibrio fluvialis]
SASVKNTILYLNTLFFVEIIKIDKNSKKSLNFHRGICVGKTELQAGAFSITLGRIRRLKRPGRTQAFCLSLPTNSVESFLRAFGSPL